MINNIGEEVGNLSYIFKNWLPLVSEPNKKSTAHAVAHRQGIQTKVEA